MQRKFLRVAAIVAVCIGGVLWATPAFAYGPNAPVIGATPGVLSPGASFTVTGANYQPGETVTLVLFSSPVTLGTTGPTDATGSFSMGVTLPADAVLGGHTIVGTGNSIGDSASTAITIAASSASAASAVSGTGGTSGSPTIAGTSGSLAFTGSDIAATAGVGAIAIALGGMLVMAGRRRRATSNQSS